MHATSTRRWLAAGAIAFLAPIASLRAQTPTPEGTTITNTATASFTDANGNSYSNVSASASVTVGYLAAPDVSSPTTVTPASPSTGNEIAFVITNAGNGTDQFSVSPSSGTGVTITGYKLGATTYATLAELNTALAALDVTAGNTATVTVVYTVAPGQGGQTIPVTLTATSVRTPAATGASDASTTNVIPAVAAAVAVTPDGATASRLPSTATVPTYSATFTVSNTGNRSDTYSLGATSGAAVSIVSVNGTAGTGSSVTVSAGGSQSITVVYSVGDVAAGTTASITLGATSGNDGAISDAGDYTVTVIRAALAISKAAFRDDQTTAVTGTVVPGEYIQYRIEVTNAGGAAASTVAISDVLPSELTYVSASGDAAGWTIGESAGTVSASLTGTLAPAASRYIWIRVRVK